MNRQELLAVAAIFAFAAGASQAQDLSGLYLGGSIGTFEADDGVDSVTPTNAVLRAGYTINPFFDVEAEVAFTISDDRVVDSGFTIDFSNTNFAIYGKGNLVISDQFALFGRLGWMQTDLTAEAAGISISEDDNAVAYGIGAQYAITQQVGLRFDATWAQFDVDGSSLDTTALSIGMDYRF